MNNEKRPVVYFFALTVALLFVGFSANTLSKMPGTAQLAQASTPTPEVAIPSTLLLVQYIQIIDSCGPDFAGECVQVRSGSSTQSPVVTQLRNGVILKVEELVIGEDGLWYKIEFDEHLRYPERVARNWYVSAKYVRMFKNTGIQELTETIATTTKYILVDRSEQILYAYENDTIVMQQSVSTGLTFTPTPRGTFQIYRKTPTRYMQGPLPGISSKYYDLPGVPWNLYFTHQGAVIHGTYWHDKFGQQWSNGCVNVPTDQAEKLYAWADIGIPVLVQD